MKILDDLIASLKRDSIVRDVYACVYWTAVVSRHCGLASTLREEHPVHAVVRETGNLRGKWARELAAYAQSDNLLEASIGMATINSLIDIDDARCVEKNVFDVLAEKARGKDVAVIGHFPLIPKIRNVARNLYVFEQKPQEGDLPAEAAEELLPGVDVVGITGTAFINHTIEKLLRLSEGKFIAIAGPTSPLSPVLFDYGVNVIGGSKVIDPEETIRTITEAAMFRQVRGVRYLTMFRDREA